jgi:PAS domain S-box-containing protein
MNRVGADEQPRREIHVAPSGDDGVLEVARRRIGRLRRVLLRDRAAGVTSPPDAARAPAVQAVPDELRTGLAEAIGELELAEWLLRHGSDAYLVTSSDGVIRRSNDAADHLLLPRPALVGKPLALFVEGTEGLPFASLLDRLATPGTTCEAALRVRCRAGGLARIRVAVTAVDRGDPPARELHWLLRPGRETAGVGAADPAPDVAAGTVREALQRLFESTLAGVVLADEERLLEANEAFLAMTGYGRDELLAGKLAWRRLLIPDGSGRDRLVLETLRRTGECALFETECRRKDGERLSVLLAGVAVRTAPLEWLSLLVDASEQKRAQAALVRARQEAESVNRAKDEFLATLGHELRNPLAAIRNAVAVLETKGGADHEVVRLHAIIARQVHHVTRLVDDLLDLSRVISGKVRLQREPIDLHRLAGQVLSGLAQTGRTREHRVAYEGEPALVHGDATRLEQVVFNLLDNAIKYTPPGGRIAISVRPDGPEAVLSVTDTGVGLTAEMAPRVFELFAQERRALDRAQGGLGLGLPLVRRLVTLHGGTVAAASPGPGQGSTFTIRLPLSTVDAPASPDARPPASASSRVARRVLVIDDHDDTRLTLRILLEDAGHTVLEAADGPGGLEAIRRGDVEIALVDVRLPGLDGYELARRVRAGPAARDVVLIAVTGYGHAEDRHRALESGFDSFLVKPVDVPVLEELLREPPRAGGAPPKGPHKADRARGPAPPRAPAAPGADVPA